MTEATSATAVTAAPEAQSALQTGSGLKLPFNLESGFGGVDVTKPVFSQSALRARLFDLVGHGTVAQTVHWGENSDREVQLDVPKFLELKWAGDNISKTVAGETKASFQRNLSREVMSGFSIAGFGAEFSETFSESHFEETYEKYVAHYEREQIYHVTIKGGPARYLSDEAAEDFETLSAAQLVDKYGTHYMTEATFGGIKVFGSRIDIRDQVDETALKSAMKTSVKVTDPESGESAEASAGSANSDQTIRKLHEKMAVTEGRTRGGQAGLDRKGWISSLYANPAVIDYKLAPLDELAGADRRASIRAEIEQRLRAQQVTSNATLLAMMVPLDHYTNDGGSGADRDLVVARPRQVPGWFYTGQYGLPQAGTFPGGFKALLFTNAPGTDPNNPAIKPATGFSRHWGKSSSYGLYRANAPANYVAVGDVYESTDDPGRIGFVYFYGCLRNDLVEPAGWTGELWNDHGSGARDDGSAWGFDNNDPKVLKSAGGANQARMFKVSGGYDQPGLQPVRPKLDRVQMLTDSWL